MSEAKWRSRTDGDAAAIVALDLPEGVSGPFENAVVEGGGGGPGPRRSSFFFLIASVTVSLEPSHGRR